MTTRQPIPPPPNLPTDKFATHWPSRVYIGGVCAGIGDLDELIFADKALPGRLAIDILSGWRYEYSFESFAVTDENCIDFASGSLL